MGDDVEVDRQMAASSAEALYTFPNKPLLSK